MGSVHLLCYDIPEVRVPRARGGSYSRPVMKNPSDRLWRAGAVRLTLSCWLVHEGAVPDSLVGDFARSGVEWECVPFDAGSAERLNRLALRSIRKEIKQYVESARETAQREDERLSKGGAEKEYERYRAQLRSVQLRVRKCLQRVQVAANRFGISPGSIGVKDAESTLSGIKHDMEMRAAAFAFAHNVLVKKRGKKDAMAVAAHAGDVPGGVLADYLDDMEDAEAGEAAKRLRSVFNHDF